MRLPSACALALFLLSAAGWAVPPPRYLVVSFYSDVGRADAARILAAAGAEPVQRPDLLETDWLVVATEDQVRALAGTYEVRTVMPASDDLIRGRPVRACPGPMATPAVAGFWVASIGNGWDGPGRGPVSLSYSYGRETRQLPREAVLEALTRALAQWQRYSRIEFAANGAPDGPRNLDISFVAREHGDGAGFDGNGGQLAHSFYPIFPEPTAGDVHLDEDETWTPEKLYSVLLHEIGHALGIGHSDRPGAVMYPYFNEFTELQPEDIVALQRIYERVEDPVTPP